MASSPTVLSSLWSRVAFVALRPRKNYDVEGRVRLASERCMVNVHAALGFYFFISPFHFASHTSSSRPLVTIIVDKPSLDFFLSVPSPFFPSHASLASHLFGRGRACVSCRGVAQDKCLDRVTCGGEGSPLELGACKKCCAKVRACWCVLALRHCGVACGCTCLTSPSNTHEGGRSVLEHSAR